METKKILGRGMWGLYSMVKEKEAPTPVPLKSLDINIQILHNTARVFYTQVYQNDSQSLLETKFFFPISPDACFDSFEAKFNETTIKGVVKEKKKAQEEYKEAISEGRTAAYSEINEETGDIMKVLIGNIPPNTEISVTYSYIQKLETSLNKFWCFRLFSTITPRYNGNLHELLKQDIVLLSSYPTISKDNSKAYPWTIKTEIQSPSPIKLLKSPSHDIVSTFGNENHTCTVTLNPSSNHFPNKDFVLLFSNGKEEEKADFVITPFEDGYCAMISLMADFEKTSREDTYENFVKAKQIESQHAMDTIRGEYIFLIDRSGSMGGDRIEMAKNSLLLFLKSLPKDSYYNVVSFGGSFELLKKESIVYSKESLQSISQEIPKFSANMGGTEIYSPLKHIFNSPLKKGYPRFVFLLTDGAVSNTSQVLELIKSNSDKARVFTIGIGNGCSPILINKGALYGRGKSEFVSDNKDTYEKVISLLNASLSPCYSDFSLEGNNFDAVVKSISPNPTTLPFLLNGQTATFFLLLREAAFDDSQKMVLKLKMYDSRIGDYRTIEIMLDKGELYENELIPKLAIHDMIKRLEEVQKENKNITSIPDIFWAENKKDIQQSLLGLSLKYGILCKETAFFCDIKENNELRNTTQAKIVVPTLISNDYQQNSRLRTSSQMIPLKSTTACVRGPSGYKSVQIQDSLLHNISPILERGEKIESLFQKSEDLNNCSYNFYKKSSASPSLGFFSKVKNGVSNITSSLFSSRNTKTLAPSKPSTAQPLSRKIIAYESYSSKVEESRTQSNLYLNVIMKQTFEGHWECNDMSLIKIVLKNEKLPQVPEELKVKVQHSLEEIWITILVLLWLEEACKSDKGAWTLIHQKGSEWLKSQGIIYEDVKSLGKSLINV